MATVNFYYRSIKKEAFLTIKLRFSIDKENYVKTSKSQIETSREIWDYYYSERINDAQIRKKVFKLREELSDLEEYIKERYNLEMIKEKVIANEWLSKVIEDFYNPNAEVTDKLANYIDYYLEVRKNEIKPHLERKMKGLKKKLIEFENEKKIEFKIRDVNEIFKIEFVNFCKAKKYSENYIKKQFSFIKQVCSHAKYNGINVSHQLEKLSLKEEKVPKIYLSFEELEKIETVNFQKENLEATKDWLLISCYTGQRISDFMRFTIDMIREENGMKLIEFTQKKTNKIMTVPLHRKVTEVIEKNKGQFPKKLLDQKYNDYLKTVCKKAKLNQPTDGRKLVNLGDESNPIYRYKSGVFPKYDLISSHVGRRSFATNFYGTIPTTFLKSITGHSTEKMLLNYIGKSDKDLALKAGEYFK